MNKEDLIKRTKQFSHNCIKTALKLPENTLGWHLQKQLIRCSTSVAANYRATCHALSKTAFISKLSIVIEEADESDFWLEFIIDENLIKDKNILELKKESNELSSIFIKSRITAQNNKNN